MFSISSSSKDEAGFGRKRALPKPALLFCGEVSKTVFLKMVASLRIWWLGRRGGVARNFAAGAGHILPLTREIIQPAESLMSPSAQDSLRPIVCNNDAFETPE